MSDPLALHYSRLAMATLTPEDFIVHVDGALYSPQMLKLFDEYGKRREAEARQRSRDLAYKAPF